jgi:Protein of unknown function (DUF3102)
MNFLKSQQPQPTPESEIIPPSEPSYLDHAITLSRAREARPEITPELSRLASAIAVAQAQIVAGLITALEGTIALGEALRALKKQVPHGEWEEFLNYHCRMSTDKAQRFMRLARNKSLIAQQARWKSARAPLSQRAALKLVSIAKTKRRKRVQERSEVKP